jgi:arabinofuranosyltransferase
MTAVLAPPMEEHAAHSVARWRRVLLAAPAYLPAVIIAVAGWSHRWMDEDAFINLRIVDQVFAGHGPVFNAGERVEAATSPLWIGVLVAGRAVFGAFASVVWIALIASLIAAVLAFVVGGQAARVLHRGRDGVVVPVGLLLVASVAVVWDFSTSGLENGLVWLWLASSWYVLVSVARTTEIGGRQRFGFGVVLGLAPLVRPELTLMMVCLLAAWFALMRPRRLLFDLVAIFSLPVAYEIFRMGYYAQLVPNTALAKDAGGLHMSQGWSYAQDFVTPYRLWVSAAVIVATMVVRHLMERDRRILIATVAMVTAAILDALYIVAIGGDYMHGRLLLPAFFALGLPASVALRKDQVATLAVGGAAAVWAVASIIAFRPPPVPRSYLLSPIADWRAVTGAKIIPKDGAFGLNGKQAAAAYDRGVRGYFRITDKRPRPAKDRDTFVLTLGSIGVPAFDAGTHVWVVDIGGLAEPLAARSKPISGRVAGHRKQVDDAWYDARFGATAGGAKARAARHALGCGPLPGLLGAVDDKLTLGRFFSNLWHSVEYTRLAVPYDPRVAEQKWCR